MIGAAGPDGQPKRHRVQRSRVVTGQLQALDMRREIRRVTTDSLGGSPAAQRQQLTQPSPPIDDRVDGLEHSGPIAEPKRPAGRLQSIGDPAGPHNIPSRTRSSLPC